MESLLTNPGWEVVQEFMKSYEANAIDALLEYKGSDPMVMRSKQMNVWCMKELRNMLTRHIEESIQAARNIILTRETNPNE